MSNPFKHLKVSSSIHEVPPSDPLYRQLEGVYGNRNVLTHDVTKIKESIKKNNLLHLQPIIVQLKINGVVVIVDGQHRLEAALSLGLSFYILHDTSSNPLNLITLNTHQRPWGLPDFLKFWCTRKETSYIYNIYKQCKEENLVSHSTLISIFNKSVNYSKASWKFKDGKLRYDSFNQEYIKDTLTKLKRVQKCPVNPPLDKTVLERKPFQLALIEAFENDTFNFEKFLDNFKRSRHKFNILGKKTDYTAEIFRIFNKKGK